MGLRAEAWVGEWFRNLGYEVHITAFQGDHGVDLILSTVGEASPAGSVGAMHHVGAHGVVLVTTGQLSKAARDWLVGKPIEVWDAPRLKQEWDVALEQLASQITQEHLT